MSSEVGPLVALPSQGKFEFPATFRFMIVCSVSKCSIYKAASLSTRYRSCVASLTELTIDSFCTKENSKDPDQLCSSDTLQLIGH